MADVVGEGAAGRGTRRLRAEVALKTVAAEPGSPDRLRRVLEQALVFGGATLAAVYAPGEDEDLLCLVESAGVPRTFYGLRDSYPRSGRSAVAGALRTGHARWLGPAELAARTESRRTSGRDFFLAALPTHGDEGGGCLLAVSERPGGFDSGDRECLELIADAVAFPALPAATEDGELPADAFSLAMDTGRVEVGDDILALFGLGPDEFDGKVETLLGLTVPEDLPSLMSVVEADHTALGDRDLEFRVLQPTGPPRWLRLRGRLLPGGEGLPARIVGTVADASTLRAEVTDVARVQRLAAALATAGTVRDVSHAVVTALRGRCAPTASPSPSWRTTVSSSPSSTRPTPSPGRSCGAWSGVPNGRTRPCARCPPSPPPCARAAPRSGPPAARWNRPSPMSAPAAWPSCRCPPGAGWSAPA